MNSNLKFKQLRPKTAQIEELIMMVVDHSRNGREYSLSGQNCQKSSLKECVFVN